MLEFLSGSAALLILAAVGMWAILIAARAFKAHSHSSRAVSHRAAGAALIKWSDLDNEEQLDAALIALDPELIPDVISRFFSLVAESEKKIVLAALERLDFAGYLEKNFRRTDQGQRLLFCELLGEIHGEHSLDILHWALTDAAPAVRVGAAISLARRGELPPIAETLERLGPAGRRTSRHFYLFEALLPDRRFDVVAVAADPSREPSLRIAALQALVRHWAAPTGPLMRVLADDSSTHVAAAVARLLGGGPHRGNGEILTRLLGHGSPIVRRVAAESAGILADPEMATAVRSLGGDPDPLVRHAAALALRRLALGGPGDADAGDDAFALERARRMAA